MERNRNNPNTTSNAKQTIVTSAVFGTIGFAAGWGLSTLLSGRESGEHAGKESCRQTSSWWGMMNEAYSANKEVVDAAMDKITSSEPVREYLVGLAKNADTKPGENTAESMHQLTGEDPSGTRGWLCSVCSTWNANSENVDLDHARCGNLNCLRPFVSVGVREGAARKRTCPHTARETASKRTAAAPAVTMRTVETFATDRRLQLQNEVPESSRNVEVGTRLRVAWKVMGKEVVAMVEGQGTSSTDHVVYFEGTVTHAVDQGGDVVHTVLYDVDNRATKHRLAGPGRVSWERL